MVTARGCPCEPSPSCCGGHDSQSDLAAEQGFCLFWQKVEEMVGAVELANFVKFRPKGAKAVNRMKARRPFKVVAIALANKMARIA
jgi:hypothetical protein